MATDKKVTHLKIVDGIVPHDGTEDDADLRQEVLDLKETMDQSRWRMAAAFDKIHDESIFQRWGYSNFDQYVETEVEMTVRTAQYLVAMYRWFMYDIEGDISDERREKIVGEVRKLGWTKARHLIGITNSENIDDWLKKAQEMSSSDLQKESKRALLEKEGGDPDDVKDVKRMTFAFLDDQHVPVEQALELAGAIAESDKKGHLLSLVCMDYVATNMAQKEAGQKNRGKYLDRIGAQFGVKIMAVDKNTNEVVHGKSVFNKISK